MPGRPRKICAMPTASETAPPVRPASFSPTSRENISRLTVLRPRWLKTCGRGVDGEVIARIHGAGRNQSQHAHQRLRDHGAVSDEARVTFLIQHFRRGAGGDQRVKARDRAAGNGHEKKWEQLSFDDRAAAMNELREVREILCWDEPRRRRRSARQSCPASRRSRGSRAAPAAARPEAPRPPSHRWPSGW